MDELARRVKLSPVRLRALFKRDLKTTPDQFVIQLKMENAIKLARDSPLTNERIVEIVGGGDVSHFQRRFKKAFGKTLGDYRRLDLQEPDEEQEE